MSVDPSSLIFVVIIGIWAAYLMQHWVRRREQVATSRSVDRFSDAMRLLERRVPVPIELPARASRGYVVAPTGPRRPEVTVTPVFPYPDTTRAVSAATRDPDGARSESARAEPAPRPATGPAPAPVRRVPAARRTHQTHRVRALVLLGLLIGTPAVWIAHIFGTLLLWPTLTVSALLVLDLLAIRRSVRLARRRASLAARRRAPHASPADARPTASRRPATTARTRRMTPRPTVTVAAKVAAMAAGMSAPEARAGVEAASAATATDEAVLRSREAVTEIIVLEGEWQPVAVPPPTYTMKAKAPRPAESRPIRDAESDSSPVREPVKPAIVVDDLELDAVLDRRSAAGA
jgi:hypothetical protein